MLAAWVAIGEGLPSSTALVAVLEFLRDRLNRYDGGRAFRFDPPPEEIKSPERLRAFAKVVAEYANQLAGDHRTAATAWFHDDRELRLRWLAQMLDLIDIVHAGVDDDGPAASLSDFPLSGADQQLCQLFRLRNRQLDLKKRGAAPEVRLDVSNQILTILLSDPQSVSMDNMISFEYLERASLRHEDDLAAIAAELKNALRYERDCEARKELEDLIAMYEQ